MTNHTNLIERQFERLREIEIALANGAHFADEAQCHPLYPHAVAARQILEARISTLTAEVEAMRLAGNELADKAHLLTFASRDEPLNKVAKAALDAWFATLTKGEGDKP